VSLRVLLFQEDATYNGFILRPLLERVFAECGKQRVSFSSITPPPKGYPQAVKLLRARLQQSGAMSRVWFFIADSDGRKLTDEFTNLENEARARGVHLVCCAAEPELEAWLVAGHKEKLGINWSETCKHPKLKEAVFAPFLKEHGDTQAVDGGRTRLMKETLRNYRGLLKLCPELAKLEQRIKKLCARKVT
jgi:hypothetical protein